MIKYKNYLNSFNSNNHIIQLVTRQFNKSNLRKEDMITIIVEISKIIILISFQQAMVIIVIGISLAHAAIIIIVIVIVMVNSYSTIINLEIVCNNCLSLFLIHLDLSLQNKYLISEIRNRISNSITIMQATIQAAIASTIMIHFKNFKLSNNLQSSNKRGVLICKRILIT